MFQRIWKKLDVPVHGPPACGRRTMRSMMSLCYVRPSFMASRNGPYTCLSGPSISGKSFPLQLVDSLQLPCRETFLPLRSVGNYWGSAPPPAAKLPEPPPSPSLPLVVLDTLLPAAGSFIPIESTRGRPKGPSIQLTAAATIAALVAAARLGLS